MGITGWKARGVSMIKLLLSSLLAVGLVAGTSWADLVELEGKTTATITNVELNKSNSVSIEGGISGSLASDFIENLLKLEDKKITVYINSPGGSIIAGNEMISAMKSSGKHITCVAKFAASMAFIIFQECDTRLVTRDGILMQHVASYGVRGQAPNNVSFLNFLESMVRDIDVRQAARIGLSYADFKTKTRDDWWLFAGQNLAANTADGFASLTCSSKLIKSKKEIVIRGFFGTLEATKSGCPLLSKLTPKKGKRQIPRPTSYTSESIKGLNAVRIGD